MRARLIPSGALVACWLVLLGLSAAPAMAAEFKFEAQLVWATDDSKPPAGKNYLPVQPEVGQKLKKLLKWKSYFLVHSNLFTLPAGTSKHVVISEKCQVDVKDLGNSNVEVVLIGKGKEVARQKQALPTGEMLVLAGNAPNDTAWLLILKRIE